MPALTVDALLSTWRRTLGEILPLRPEVAGQFLSVNIDPHASSVLEGGLVVAKRDGPRGWIAALLVEPRLQGRGLGDRLLKHALDTLARSGVAEVVLGADLLHLLPGVPEPGPSDFFRRRGFAIEDRLEFDLACSLVDRRAPDELPEVEPAAHWEEVLEFLAAEFPGRWRWEAEEARRRGGSPSYFLLLRVGGETAGFARVHHQEPGAPPPGLIAPSGFWSPAFPGYGGLGPIGVGSRWRGRGLGLGLLEAAMAHLRQLGVAELAVDWTTLTDFYARVGLAPCRAYRRGRLRFS